MPPSTLPPTTPASSAPAYPLPANIQLALQAKLQGQTDPYGNTTRCLCHDNTNSDGFMLSCDTCIAEGTPVALRYGLAVPVEAVKERGCEVLAVREGKAGAMCKSVVERGAIGTNVKGERAVCRMWLANGRYLDMTDDHPVFVRGKQGGAAVSRRVKELKTGSRHALNASGADEMVGDEAAMVMMGVDAAVDDSRLDSKDERCWSLSLDDSNLPPLSFSPLPLPMPESPLHHTVSHRDRALAFARVLGYVMGCGRQRMYTDNEQLQSGLSVTFRHWLDMEEWVKDVNLVLGNGSHSSCKQRVRVGRGRLSISLPWPLSAALSRLIGSPESGSMLTSGVVSPPAFLDCTSSRPPISFLREYVAALFGALGDPVRCYNGRPDLYPAVTLTLASHKSTFGSSSLLLSHISSLLSLLGMDGCMQRISRRHRSLRTPPSYLHIARPITFSRLVSYRYAALKQLRLSVGCAYLHYRSNVMQQRLRFPASLSASHSSSFISQKHSKHIDSTMPTLHASSSPSSPLRFSTFSRFLSVIGLPSLFSGFSLPLTATSLPAYFLPIVALQPLSSPLPVYDLSMQAGQSPSFLAASVFVHNCEVWQHGDCFPEVDTRVLTSCGLLFLDQIEERQAKGEEVLFGCYDVQSRELRYSKGTLVLPTVPPQELLEFSSLGEDARWAERSGSCGIEGLHEDNICSRHVSLRVTPNHRMFVQQSDKNAESEPYRVVKACSLLPSDCTCPPTVQGELDCKHRSAHVRMLDYAKHGYNPQTATTRRQAAQLHFQLSAAQFAAFIELLGFWLRSGTLQYHGAKSVLFDQLKKTDFAWLKDMLSKVGLSSSTSCMCGDEEHLSITQTGLVRLFRQGVRRHVQSLPSVHASVSILTHALVVIYIAVSLQLSTQ